MRAHEAKDHWDPIDMPSRRHLPPLLPLPETRLFLLPGQLLLQQCALSEGHFLSSLLAILSGPHVIGLLALIHSWLVNPFLSWQWYPPILQAITRSFTVMIDAVVP